MNLTTTLALLAAEAILLGLCLWQERKPAKFGHVRLIPYRMIMLLLVVVGYATLAHALALYTGNPIVPRTQKYGR